MRSAAKLPTNLRVDHNAGGRRAIMVARRPLDRFGEWRPPQPHSEPFCHSDTGPGPTRLGVGEQGLWAPAGATLPGILYFIQNVGRTICTTNGRFRRRRGGAYRSSRHDDLHRKRGPCDGCREQPESHAASALRTTPRNAPHAIIDEWRSRRPERISCHWARRWRPQLSWITWGTTHSGRASTSEACLLP